jgi:hypothetical protein
VVALEVVVGKDYEEVVVEVEECFFHLLMYRVLWCFFKS